MSVEMCMYELSSNENTLSKTHNSTTNEEVYFCFERH